MNLDRLKIFHAVAKFQSFTRASEKLFLTQPGISKHIKLLEEFYGTTLFDRLGKKIALTQAGKILYEATKDIFSLIDEAKARIDDIEGLATGALKVGASFTIGIYIAPDFLAEFRNQHPNISVSLDISLSRHIVNKVRRNLLDVGLVGAPPKDEKLISARVLMDELVVIIPHDHKWANRKKLRPKELTEQPFILSKVGSGTRQTIMDRLKNNGVILKNYLEFGNTEAVKKAVESGLGISILSKYVVSREVEAGLLVAIPLSKIDLMRGIFLIYHKDKYLTNTIRSFMDLFEL
ncbi:MAG: selenium metabolism-associated LysR family transcriptional regulator [Desulfobacterales bacterium]|jgi:DNA-binding transcriptional LysR family regulator